MDLLLKVHQDDDFVVHNTEEPFQSCNLLNSIIVPRPIAFITTKGENGVINAAPFSYFNVVCRQPPLVSISIERRNGQRKDTARNILSTREFVINICSIEMAKAINLASQDLPPEISEISLTKLSLLPSIKISAPRVANTFIQLECLFHQAVEVAENLVDLILGRIVNVHVHKSVLTHEGKIDIEKLNPIARLSGSTYAKIKDFFDVSS